MINNPIILTVLKDDEGIRLDKLLSEKLDFSRSFIAKAIEKGEILVNDLPCEPKKKLKEGSVININIGEPEEIDALPEDIPIDIVYEDSDIAVINKPQGMVVHPAPGNYSGTLVNAVLYHISDLSGINGKLRPGIVHRLDKDTSGLIVIAKNDDAHVELQRQIQCKEARRSYYALVYGSVKNDFRIQQPIGRHKTDRKKMAVVSDGRYAATNFTVVEQYKGYTLLRADLETGRTHQIRVHLAHAGHSIVCDPLYGRKEHAFKLKGQLLHAFELSFSHPKTGDFLSFTAELPQYFKDVLLKLEKLE